MAAHGNPMPTELIQEYLPFLPIAAVPAAVEPHGIQEKVSIPMAPWRQRIAIFIVPRNAITPRRVPYQRPPLPFSTTVLFHDRP